MIYVSAIAMRKEKGRTYAVGSTKPKRRKFEGYAFNIATQRAVRGALPPNPTIWFSFFTNCVTPERKKENFTAYRFWRFLPVTQRTFRNTW
jgi:hypothetical protein